MVYQLLAQLFRFALRVYFSKIEIQQLANMPTKGPLVIVANHRASFLDPILIACLINRPLHFIARGESFNHPLKRWIWRQLNMIPIYRPQFTPKLVKQNVQVFQHCHELLQEGGAILIFPEGISRTDLALRPIKTGAARIALGALSYAPDLKVIPIGINYSNPHQFRSKVLLNIGVPIAVKDFKTSPSADKRTSIYALCEAIRSALKKQVIVVNPPEQQAIFQMVERIYKKELEVGPPELPRPGNRSFVISQDIKSAIQWLQQHPNMELEFLQNRMARFLTQLDFYGIQCPYALYKAMNDHPNRFAWRHWCFLLCSLPHQLPLRLTKWLTHRFTRRMDFIGPLYLCLGVLIGLLYYGGVFLLLMNSAMSWPLMIGLLLYWLGSAWLGIQLFERLEGERAAMAVQRLRRASHYHYGRLLAEHRAIMREFRRLRELFIRDYGLKSA